MRDTIKQIVFQEFSKLTDLIERDFAANYARKVNNFLLSQMDESITASMVFVSSFESKSGFAIETCAKRIARMKFGEENVPAIVNPRNLPHSFDAEKISGQIVVTDVEKPRDGSYYSDDMKNIFPNSVRNDMKKVHTDGTIDGLKSEIKQKMEDYFEEIKE